MLNLNDKSPNPGNMEIIRDVMTKRDIIMNMEYAERRKKKNQETVELLKPRYKGLTPGMRIALGIAEGIVLCWVLYGASIFIRKAFESAMTLI